MSSIDSILPFSIALGPDAALDSILVSVPGKWGVVLLCDQNAAPLQILCTRNMRAMLRRRFELPAEPQSPSKRLDYRAWVRSIRWQRVDSELEMDLVYIEAARVCFPVHWRGLIPDRRAFFVTIDLSQTFPDFKRVTEPEADGIVFGPFVDKTKADRWIDQVRDAFDLCRYHNILVQSPHGRACTYKQMGKCPAPCDGSVSMESYRSSVAAAVESVTNVPVQISQLKEKMNRHAAALEFESAGREKLRLDRLNALGGGVHHSIRPLGSFDYLAVQSGARKGTAKIFRVKATGVVEVAGVRGEAFEFELLKKMFDLVSDQSECPPGVILGAVCHYLGRVKSSGTFLRLATIDEAQLRNAVRAAMKFQPAADDAETIRETAIPS